MSKVGIVLLAPVIATSIEEMSNTLVTEYSPEPTGVTVVTPVPVTVTVVGRAVAPGGELYMSPEPVNEIVEFQVCAQTEGSEPNIAKETARTHAIR
jgi:hypothetical protein